MKKHGWLAIFLLFDIILILFFVPMLRSMAVMSVYSIVESQNSVFKKSNITIDIPGGLSTKEKDWYPFVMTYNADYFSSYVDQDVDLTILYNFGAFNNQMHCSTLYDEESDFHGAFYGAYGIQTHNDTAYGYSIDGELDTQALADIFRYDMNILVLKSIGCDDTEFSYSITNHTQENLFGMTFDVVDAVIKTNSPLHKQSNFYPAYIQYGTPYLFHSKKDFKKTTAYGKMYSTYIDAENMTLCFYVIAPNQEMIDSTMNRFIKKTNLSFN